MTLPPSQAPGHEEHVAAARAALSEAAFAAAWAEGRQLSPVAARAEAAKVAHEAATERPDAATEADGAGLIPRERDVLRLLVEGRSDKEIADVLFLTRRTASKHVSAILAKLGAPSRSAAAAVATRNRLA